MLFDYDKFGSAFVAMRLHRLRVLLTEQYDTAFLKLGVEAPSLCASTLLFLAQRGPASIAQIARATGYSHQLINQRLALLEALELSERLTDPHDARKCTMSLTRKGHAEAKKLEAALSALSDAIDDLNVQTGVDLARAAHEATEALFAVPLIDRIQRKTTPRKRAKARTHKSEGTPK